jgi:DNA-binding YbaB/EbfC family protein
MPASSTTVPPARHPKARFAEEAAVNPNYQKMMKQVQKMQADMAKMQEDLANDVVEASAGGGMVTVQVTGAIELKSIKIDPAAIDPEDVEILEDMIMAATNEALRSAQELANKKLGGITSGLNIPGLPF